jgi:hypothetical protein
MLKKMMTKKLHTGKKKRGSVTMHDSDSSDFDFVREEKKEEEKLFLPCTFEGMMEAFGVNQ